MVEKLTYTTSPSVKLTLLGLDVVTAIFHYILISVVAQIRQRL